MNLTDKKVLITGASRGIGAAFAESFAHEGAELVLCARDTPTLALTATSLRERYGSKVSVHSADLRNAAQIGALADASADVEVLVNNAGDIAGGSLASVDANQWRHAWDLKVYGYIDLTRLIYASMKERGRGVIINNIGTAGERPAFHYIAGSTGNAALMAFTRSLGAMSLFDNIRVVGVNPGAVGTERSMNLKRQEAVRRWGDERRSQELYDELPLGRPAKPSEVADLIVFLASERAGYISGSIHTIDGGGGVRPPGANRYNGA